MKNMIIPGLATLLLMQSAHGTTRPSVSGNASRITILEQGQLTLRSDVNINSGDIDVLQQQIDANRNAIASFEASPGPQGPAGAPGPLSGLQCEAGEVAMWNGTSWVCASIGGNATMSNDNCIRGFAFAYTYQGAATQSSWSILCESQRDLYTDVSISGSFITQSPRQNVNDQITLDGEPEFSENLIAIDFLPLDVNQNYYPENNSLYVELTLTALSDGQSSGIKSWATSEITPTSAQAKSLNIQFAGNLFALDLRECIATAYNGKPIAKTVSRDEPSFYVQERITLRCHNIQSINFAEHEPLANFLAEKTGGSEGPLTGPLDINFEASAIPDLSDFDRRYPSSSFVRYQFANFYRLLNSDSGRVIIGPWEIGGHTIEFVSQNINEPL